jgi:hypothetical protein
MSWRHGRNRRRQRLTPIRSRLERFDLPKRSLKSTGRYPLLGSANSRDESKTLYKPSRVLRLFTKKWKSRLYSKTRASNVRFPDPENSRRADIFFQHGAASGLIECKALSADAGRKICRKHFYRFIDAISQEVLDRMSTSGVDELILITSSMEPPGQHDSGSGREEFSSFLRDFAYTGARFRHRAP